MTDRERFEAAYADAVAWLEFHNAEMDLKDLEGIVRVVLERADLVQSILERARTAWS